MTKAIKPTRTTHLRHLTVYVDEPDHGQFYWVLIESKGDAVIWEDIEAAAAPFPTWATAFEAGTRHLTALVLDPDVGPQAPGEDEGASPVG